MPDGQHLQRRVPLLVVSPYTQAGYVSGDTRTVGETTRYIHDFGSLLAFTEYNFFGASEIGMINSQYPFADGHAPDGVNGHIPLSDFFLSPYRSFTPIGVSYSVSYFQNYQGNPEGPGDDGSED